MHADVVFSNTPVISFSFLPFIKKIQLDLSYLSVIFYTPPLSSYPTRLPLRISENIFFSSNFWENNAYVLTFIYFDLSSFLSCWFELYWSPFWFCYYCFYTTTPLPILWTFTFFFYFRIFFNHIGQYDTYKYYAFLKEEHLFFVLSAFSASMVFCVIYY